MNSVFDTQNPLKRVAIRSLLLTATCFNTFFVSGRNSFAAEG